MLTDQVNRVTREHLTGLRVVRAYNAEAYQAAKFEIANENLTRTSLFTSRLMSAMQPGMMLIMNGMNLAIYWVGAYLIQAAGVSLRVGLFADMVVFSSYAMQIVMSFDMMIMIFIMAPRAIVSANRILEVIETEPEIRDGVGTVPAETGTIRFDHVSFRYPGAADNVLTDIFDHGLCTEAALKVIVEILIRIVFRRIWRQIEQTHLLGMQKPGYTRISSSDFAQRRAKSPAAWRIRSGRHLNSVCCHRNEQDIRSRLAKTHLSPGRVLPILRLSAPGWPVRSPVRRFRPFPPGFPAYRSETILSAR